MRLFIILSVAFLVSCSQQEHSELTEKEKAGIATEIGSVVDHIREAASHADTTGLFEAFKLDDQFLYIETSGAFYNEAQYRAMARKWYGMITAEIIEKGSEKFVYLDHGTVLWSYSGALRLDFKSGEKNRFSPFGMTMLFRKFGTEWKIVFMQESTQEAAATLVK